MELPLLILEKLEQWPTGISGLKRPSAGAASGPGQPQGSIQAGDEGLEQPWEKDWRVLVGESWT